MTWRRLTRAEADAEARAAWLQDRLVVQEHQRQLLQFLTEQEADREARVEVSRPLLHGLNSAQLLDLFHDAYELGTTPLACDLGDVLHVVLDEIRRRRQATAHERIRFRELDRKS